MPRDYAQSAVRHYRDAEHLAQASRFCGAGHLVGLAVERALKHTVRNYTNPRNAEIEGHLPILKREIRRLLSGRGGRPLSLANDRTFFEDWHITDRYQDDAHVDAERYDAWKNSTLRTLGIAQPPSGAAPNAPAP
ncbi:hypothetical protein [Skermanella pratensis]|uniref:hypothetical protein n=1 Tax=Skermanella pratensis TaxID=2233999 RepID=UPI0013018E70|nr:hypothetical protein [Skermanella pratensis]